MRGMGTIIAALIATSAACGGDNFANGEKVDCNAADSWNTVNAPFCYGTYNGAETMCPVVKRDPGNGQTGCVVPNIEMPDGGTPFMNGCRWIDCTEQPLLDAR